MRTKTKKITVIQSTRIMYWNPETKQLDYFVTSGQKALPSNLELVELLVKKGVVTQHKLDKLKAMTSRERSSSGIYFRLRQEHWKEIMEIYQEMGVTLNVPVNLVIETTVPSLKYATTSRKDAVTYSQYAILHKIHIDDIKSHHANAPILTHQVVPKWVKDKTPLELSIYVQPIDENRYYSIGENDFTASFNKVIL